MQDECRTISPAAIEFLPQPSTEDGRMRALLIEQEEGTRDYVQSMLQHETFQVSAFNTTDGAIEELRLGLRPDVASINATIPTRQDVSALKWFQQVHPTVPTIALSCSYDPRAIVDAV